MGEREAHPAAASLAAGSGSGAFFGRPSHTFLQRALQGARLPEVAFKLVAAAAVQTVTGKHASAHA